jgi:hypothetical protein
MNRHAYVVEGGKFQINLKVNIQSEAWNLKDPLEKPLGYFAAAVIAADTSPSTKTSNVNPLSCQNHGRHTKVNNNSNREHQRCTREWCQLKMLLEEKIISYGVINFEIQKNKK